MLEGILKDREINPVIIEKLQLPSAFEFKIDFSFHTNKYANAVSLKSELISLGYAVSIRKDYLLYVIEDWEILGWTSKMSIDNSTISNWTESMHRMGLNYDCRFDRWGTFTSESIINRAIENGYSAKEMTEVILN